jgi:excisionase family DNA binding protein
MSRTKTKPDRRANGSTPVPVPTNYGEVMTLAEAASYLRVAESEVLESLRERGLPGQKVGGDWRLLKAAIDRWLGLAAPAEQGKFWQAQFGALRNDPYLEDLVRDAYRKRGRPESGEE